MNEHTITTEAIAELVQSHGAISAPDVGKHFGQPYWICFNTPLRVSYYTFFDILAGNNNKNII